MLHFQSDRTANCFFPRGKRERAVQSTPAAYEDNLINYIVQFFRPIRSESNWTVRHTTDTYRSMRYGSLREVREEQTLCGPDSNYENACSNLLRSRSANRVMQSKLSRQSVPDGWHPKNYLISLISFHEAHN